MFCVYITYEKYLLTYLLKVTVSTMVILEQAMNAQRYSITLSLTSPLYGVSVQRHAQSLYPRERPGTHFIGGWVGLTAGLDGCGKPRPQRDSIPGQSSP